MFAVRFWVDVVHGEKPFVDIARKAGHRRVHDIATAEFFIVESNSLVNADGRLVDAGRPGDVTSGPSPRFEFQVLSSPAHRDDIGQFSTFTQIVDRTGRVTSIGFGTDLDSEKDSLVDFLLHVGEGPMADTAVELDEAARVAEAVEEFLTLWTMAADDLELDANTRRVGDALAAMVGEVVKTDEPPPDVLRSAFNWFAAKFDHFSHEFAGSAGKALGTSFGVAASVGAGAAISGGLSELADAIGKVLRLLQ